MMDKGRLEAFSDGVMAIIITIMVLELVAPEEASLATLVPLIPTFAGYALSFVFIAIYWNNHHHLFQAAERVNGSVLWANMFLLFWLSLVPFATAWMSETQFAATPVALYGLILLLAGVAYYVLSHALIALHGRESVLAVAIGEDLKGRVSLVAYLTAIGLAFINPWVACGVYVLVAILWLIPDRRIERILAN
jgi:uncharacterized membrane protein